MPSIATKFQYVNSPFLFIFSHSLQLDRCWIDAQQDATPKGKKQLIRTNVEDAQPEVMIIKYLQLAIDLR
jgi:hypothetical protein